MEERVMSTTTLRFLQQENARLQEENKTLREENLGLRQYIDALKSLAWATQQITLEQNLLVLIDQIFEIINRGKIFAVDLDDEIALLNTG